MVLRAKQNAAIPAACAVSGMLNRIVVRAAVQEGLLSAVVGGVPQNGGLRRGGPLQLGGRQSFGQQGTLTPTLAVSLTLHEFAPEPETNPKPQSKPKPYPNPAKPSPNPILRHSRALRKTHLAALDCKPRVWCPRRPIRVFQRCCDEPVWSRPPLQPSCRAQRRQSSSDVQAMLADDRIGRLT